MLAVLNHHALRDCSRRALGGVLHILGQPHRTHLFIDAPLPGRGVGPIRRRRQFRFGEMLDVRVLVGQLEIAHEIAVGIEHRVMAYAAIADDENR